MTSLKRFPYPGLRAFTRDESDLFFGREGCVDAMVDRLAAIRLLAVLGASGSGKSSLVRTGLLEALELGFNARAGTSWNIADMHPGGQPIRKLAAALLNVIFEEPFSDDAIDSLTAFLSQGPRSLSEWIALGNLEPGANLLILVDQFEELFRYGDYAQREDAEAFVALLLESATDPAGAIHVVLTMRSEYLGACASIPGLAERISAGLYLTPRMDREECREAIEGPARVIGFRVEPALVNRLLNDLASFAPWGKSPGTDLAAYLSHQADQLPLMQHVLNRLWVQSESLTNGASVVLQLTDYEKVGGLSGALDDHGAGVIAGIGESKTRAIEIVFRALVTGTSLATAVRRPCRFGELVQVTAMSGFSRDDVVAIVEAFRAPGCNFLRTSETSLEGDHVIVDISHESLIRQWTPLRQWLEKEIRDSLAWRRLISAEERYRQHEGGLLTGLDLSSLTAWWESAKPTSAWAMRHGNNFEGAEKFLRTSQTAAAAEASSRQLAQTRERNRLRAGVAGLLLALIFAAGLGVIAWKEWQLARLQASESKRQALEAIRAKDALEDFIKKTNQKEFDAVNKVGEPAAQPEAMAWYFSQRNDTKQRAGTPNVAASAQDDFFLGEAFKRYGDATTAMKKYAESYGRDLKDVEQLREEQHPEEPLAINFINSGSKYAWFLFDSGMVGEGEKVAGQLDKLARRCNAHTASPELLLALAQVENLQSRIAADRKEFSAEAQHLLKGIDLASRAYTAKPALDTITVLFNLYRNQALVLQGTEKDAISAKACALANRMRDYDKEGRDLRSIGAWAQCLLEQGGNASSKNNFGLAMEKIQAARHFISEKLKMEPGNQTLLLLMVRAEIDTATLYFRKGDTKAKDEHDLKAETYFVKALQGRTLLQSNTKQIKSFYTDFNSIDFPKPEKEGSYSPKAFAFYREILTALKPSLEAFPNSPSFAYVAADASSHLGDLLKNDTGRAREAERYLSLSIESFEKSEVMRNLKELKNSKDPKEFSEAFAAYCGTVRTRIQVYSATKKVDQMLADVRRLKADCTPALDAFPFDFYLRSDFLDSAEHAGKLLFELHRYQEALPHLEYASHWGAGSSTKILADMYHTGSGVPQDDTKAKALEAQASGQTMKRFTVPADFGGAKLPFYVYVREWPAEYPYEGIDDQVLWLKNARGGKIDPAIPDSFHKLQKIARDNKVSFPELCAYALGTVDKDKNKEAAKPSTEKTSDKTTEEKKPASTEEKKP